MPTPPFAYGPNCTPSEVLATLGLLAANWPESDVTGTVSAAADDAAMSAAKAVTAAQVPFMLPSPLEVRPDSGGRALNQRTVAHLRMAGHHPGGVNPGATPSRHDPPESPTETA